MPQLILVLVVLVAIGYGIYYVFLGLFCIVGLFLAWGPPGFLCLLVVVVPRLHTEIASVLINQHGIGGWSGADDSIRAKLRAAWLPFFVFLFSLVALFTWVSAASWERLSLARSFESDTLQILFTRQDDGTSFLRILLTVIPGIGVAWCIERLLSFLVVRRVREIYCLVGGLDEGATELGRLDEKITATYRELGARSDGKHREAWSRWISGNVKGVIKDPENTAAEFARRKKAGIAELEELMHCARSFERVKGAYANGLTRLRRMTSVALLASLEDAGRSLVAEQFCRLVEAERYEDVRKFLDEVETELIRVDGLADEWNRTQGDGSAAVASVSMTVERALRVLGISRNYTREDVDRRRKELAKIYHPDRAATDDELRMRNQESMKEINQACELLLSERR